MDYNQPTGSYNPHYDETIVRQLLKQFERTPGAFNENLIAQMHEDANHYGLDFEIPHVLPEEDFSLSETIKQAGSGFISGFTTFNVGDEPQNTAERIARNIGNLAGFVGYIPALPAKAGLLANAARALKGKSIPMLISGKATEAVSKVASDVTRQAIAGRGGAFKAASEFLQKSPVKNTLEGAFHLGVASSVSAWQGGVDEMMHGFIGGAQTGAIFRVIGNAIRLPGAGVPRFGAKWGELTQEQQAEKALRGMSASLFMGLPATMRGETAPEQIYEYLLGAYFGMNEMPGEVRRRDKQMVELFKQAPKDNPFKLPELSPGFEKLSEREKKLVHEERNMIWDEKGAIISQRLQDLLGQNFKIPDFKEERTITEPPEPTSEMQFNTRNSLSSGTDINAEIWKTMSKEDKAYYSKAAEGLGFRGLYTWTEVSRWDRNELESVAKILKIKNTSRLDDMTLATEIIYNQKKDLGGIAETIAMANKTDTVATQFQDIGERLDFDAVETRSVNFVKTHLEPFFEKLEPFQKNQTIKDLSREIEFQVYEELSGPSPNSRVFMEWAENRFKTEFSDDAHGSIRQWFKLAAEAEQVAFISPRIKISMREEADGTLTPDFETYVDRLSTSGTPIDAQGNTKLLRFPKNRLDMIGEEIFKDGAPTYMVADDFVVSDGAGMNNMSLFRMKQKLERDYSEDFVEDWITHADGKKEPVFGINPDGSRRKVGHNYYYEQMYNVFDKMAKQDYFYFGGAGDKERAYFVRKHPNTLEKLDYNNLSGQLGEIVRAISPTKGKAIFKEAEASFLRQFNYKEDSPDVQEAKDYHARSFVSNYLWDLHQQGFRVPDWNQHGIVERKQLILRGLEEGLLSNPKDYNKRAQVWFTNGFSADSKFLDLELPPEVKLATETIGNKAGKKVYNVLIVKDADGKNINDLSEAFKYVESTDGAIIEHDKVMQAEAYESGMPMPKEQGQSKSFIVSPSERHGAMLGKYMKHAAGETLSKAMETYVDPVTGEVTPIHMIMYESAIKQMGSRKAGTYDLVNGELKSDSEIYKIRPEEQHVVLSELQNEHYIKPQALPTQMLSSMAPSVMHAPAKQEVLDDMIGTLIDKSYYSTNRGSDIINRMKANPEDNRIHVEFIKNFKDMGVTDVVDILRTPDLSSMHDLIYREIARVSKSNLSELSVEGEYDFQDLEAANNLVNDFNSGTQRALDLGAAVGGKHNVPTLGTMLYKHTNPYIEVIMNNWIVNKATRPMSGNSATARMRPYDVRLRQLIPDLKENEFYLDNYFKEMEIRSRLKEKNLGDIWEKYEANQYDNVQKKTAEEIFRSVTTRVPMDSVSGAQVLTFKGFTGRKGHGVLLHPKVMRAEGGADLDGDKAFIFMGGMSEDGRGSGFKQSWMDMYESNKNEYTKYRNKNTGEVINQDEYTNQITPPVTLPRPRKGASGVSHYDGAFKGLEPKYDAYKNQIQQDGQSLWGKWAVWYGDVEYNYANAKHQPKAMPEMFQQIARQVEKALGVEEGYFNSSLINLMPKGTQIGKHDDAEGIFVRDNQTVGKVATISLGGTSEIKITNNAGQRAAESYSVKGGDLYIMPGKEFQLNNKHEVGNVSKERISMTFRHIPKKHLKEAPVLTKPISKKFNPKEWEPYTTDNKNEPLRHPKYDMQSARELFTAEAKEPIDAETNQMLYYSPFGRSRMSEAASMGRFLLGDVVIMKKNMAGAHSMISNMPGSRHIDTKTIFADDVQYEVAYETIAKQHPRDLELFRQLSRTGVALGSDPMNEAGLAHYNKFFNHLHESLFEVNVVDIKVRDPETKETHNVPRDRVQEEAARLIGEENSIMFDRDKENMYPYQKLRNSGIYRMFSEANNAYFGRNWMENRRHTFAERRRKASPLANMPPEHRNSIQPKVASLLDKVEYEESLISRLNPEKINKIYEEYERVFFKYSPLRKSLERRGFVVKKNKDLDYIIENKLWMEENKVEYTESMEKFLELFEITAKNTKQGEAEGDRYKYWNPHTRLKFRNPQTSELLTFEETMSSARVEERIAPKDMPEMGYKKGDKMEVEVYLNTGRSQEAWRRYHIEAMVEKQDHMFQQDMADMISIKRIAEKAEGLTEEQIADITTEASNIRGLDKVLNKNRRRITINPEKEKNEELWEKELDADINRLGFRESAAVTQAEIESKTREAQDKYNPKERALFDEFMMGTVHRSNKAQVDKRIDELTKTGQLTDEMERFLLDKRQRTDETSLTQFAFRNRAIGDKALKEWLTEYNDKFNLAMELPTVKEVLRTSKEAEKANEGQLITGGDGKKVDVNLFEDPFEGLRGLKDGKLDAEGEKILAEAEEHITYYHNSFGSNLPDIIAGVLKKNLDAMTYEDWRIFNNTFKRLRTRSLWDIMFNAFTKGKPDIMKRYYWLFPETIDRKLMAHDFQLMKKIDIVMDKEGHFKDRIVKFPIHQMGKNQHIMASTQQSMSSASEEEGDKFRRVLNPLMEGVPEGRTIYDLATTEMEMGTAKWLLERAQKEPEKAKKYHAQSQEYHKNFNSLRAKVNEADLMAKTYEVPIVNAEGHTTIMKMTGEQYKKSFVNLLAAQNEKMHGWLNGNPKHRELFLSRDAKGNVRSFHEEGKEGFEKYDVNRFIEYAEDLMIKGQDIPRDIGMDVIRGIVRQYQYNVTKDPIHRKKLAEMSITPTKNIPFQHYIPHIILNQQKATKAMMNSIKSIMNEPSNKMSEKQKASKIQKILFHHHQVTGDWLTPEIKQWELFDNVKHHLDKISDRMTSDQLRSYSMYAKPGVSHSREIHAEGWSNEPRIYDKYMRSVFGSYYRSIGQLLSRDSMDKFVEKYEPEWGRELTQAWEKFMGIYINNASGFPAVLPPEYLEDPYLNVKGTPYAWWADNNVQNKINKVLDKFGMTDKDLPKEMKGVSLEDIRNWSNLEAKWQLASLLAHPKTAIGNIYGGTALTISNTGFGNFRKARNINWLNTKLNPGKDKFGNEWHTLKDINQYVTNLGVVPEMITYELNIHPEVKTANQKAFFNKAIKKIKRDPDVKDETLRGMMQEYGLSDAFWNKAAWFMRTSERILRRDSFMAHLIQAWENYGGALPHDHPVLIEHAKRGVKATQFLYNAPFRPLFAQTQLGKVMTRFQLWSWNSVRFRNDVMREAAKYGWREGSTEFERFRRTAQLDMLMLALSSVFMYSLFEAALPAPWNWFQDTADWIFGNEKERDRAFFGAWPSQVAPLQMVTPPAARMLPATFKGLVEQDWSKLSDYVIWTMFPFGRLARDVVGPNGIIENPARSVEKVSGLPYLQFGRTIKEEREKEKLFPEGLLTW